MQTRPHLSLSFWCSSTLARIVKAIDRHCEPTKHFCLGCCFVGDYPQSLGKELLQLLQMIPTHPLVHDLPACFLLECLKEKRSSLPKKETLTRKQSFQNINTHQRESSPKSDDNTHKNKREPEMNWKITTMCLGGTTTMLAQQTTWMLLRYRVSFNRGTHDVVKWKIFWKNAYCFCA